MKWLYLKGWLLVLSVLFVGACNLQKQEQPGERKAEVIRETGKKYGGNKCEEEERGHKCYEHCKEIYRKASNREDCENLTVGQVEKIKEMYDFLESPRERELKGIEKDVFDLYLNISIESLYDLIGEYSNSRAKDFMSWLLENQEFAEIFEAEDNDFEAFESLLQGIKDFNCCGASEIIKPFTVTVEGSKTVWDIVADQRSDYYVDWFMNFIEEKNPDCNDDSNSIECFEIYCRIGEKTDKDNRDNLLRIDSFKKYIDGIIDDNINGEESPGGGSQKWDTTEIDDSDDLRDWVEELCGGLT